MSHRPDYQPPRIDIDREAAAITRAIKSMLEKARTAGVERPYVFFEAEGSVYVIDKDHPGDMHSDAAANRRQEAICGRRFLAVPFDVGAW